MGVVANEEPVISDKVFQSRDKREADEESGDSDCEMLDSSKDFTELGESYLTEFCKKAASAFFRQHGLISHQINSYNDFIEYGIKNVFDFIGEIKVEPGYDPRKKGEGEFRHALVRFGDVSVERPKFWSGTEVCLDMYPRHARLQNMTYSARISVNTHFEVYTQKMKEGKEQFLHREIVYEEDKDIFVGRLPVMVKSDLCWMKDSEKVDCDFDEGGYFIVKGAEKTFIAQEQPCLKRLWIATDPYWRIAYRLPFRRKNVIAKLVENPKVGNVKGGEKVLRVYCLLVEVPVWVLFFALGVSSDREIVDLIECGTSDGHINNIIMASIRDADEECEGFRHRGRAVSYLDKLMKARQFPPEESAEELLKSTLFPNICGLKKKARFLGYMLNCLLQAFSGRRKVENRDDFRNKRIHLSAELLEHELYVHVKHAVRRMVKSMQRDMYGDRRIDSISDYFEASIVTNGLSRAFSTGAWAHPFKKTERISGVVAGLRRTNPLQAYCDMRKTRQQVSYTGRVGEARYPHPSHWGRLCFLATPDGENCGLVKNLAVTGIVTSVMKEPVIEKLFSCGMEELMDDTSTPLSTKDKVILDGEWVGLCSDSLSFVQELRMRRRHQQLPSQMEVKRDVHNREVRIFCDSGRILRPLLVVENLREIKSLKGSDCSFQSLIGKGIIEMIGVEEEEDCHTAWGIKYLFTGVGEEPGKYTHCELDPSFLLSLSCGIIPFANHDHARRTLYQSAKHSGQAMGFFSTNPNIRLDTASHKLYYPQKPLFRTVLSDCLGKPEFFNGQNAIVAVNVHFGYNQEDSLVMSRASMERGMFRSEHVRSYKSEVENKESEKKSRVPDDVFAKMHSEVGRADCLDDEGFPFVGANLESRDIIIGRRTAAGADHSLKLKHTEKGTVQKVVVSSNNDGKNFATVSLRQVRSPCLGDKFSSMHGQKGVLGFLESQENLPFTIQGIVPDVVINPHAFPSRQTPGQLLEAALGKVIALSRDGSSKYATPFSTLTVESIAEQLHKAGFSRWGNERVYNGRTGEKIQSMIFMGPTFYQRLVHMAEDKVKFRNTGPVHPLTRQPVADRKRFGGVKFGEMERDCLIAHGASTNLHERLFTLSDATQMHVCRKCNNVANVIVRAGGTAGRRKIRGPYCRFCEAAEEIVKVNVPYGAKLLCQELFSMGISLKFETQLS